MKLLYVFTFTTFSTCCVLQIRLCFLAVSCCANEKCLILTLTAMKLERKKNKKQKPVHTRSMQKCELYWMNKDALLSATLTAAVHVAELLHWPVGRSRPAF